MMLRGVGRAPLSSATGHLNLRIGATDSSSNRSRGRTNTKVAGGVSLPHRLKPVKPAGRHDFRSFSARQVDQQAASTSRREGEGEDAAVSGTGTTVLLEVAGMRCGGCSANVKKRLLEHPRVKQASVNLLTGTAAVTLDLHELGDEASGEEVALEVAEAVESKGFKCKLRSRGAAEPERADAEDAEGDWDDFRGLALSAGFLALCCGHHLGHVFHAAGLHQLAGVFGGHAAMGAASDAGFTLFGNRFVQSAAATAALVGPGRDIIVDGFKSLKNGVPNMNTLVGVGTGAALAVGLSQALGLPATAAWADSSHLLEEPVMLLSVILLGRVLERRAKRRATRELRALGSLVPKESMLVFDQRGVARNGDDPSVRMLETWNDFETAVVRTDDVMAGDTVKVLPGETIPVDGEVVAGRSAVDESVLTGESALVAKAHGSEVAAGTINYDGALVVRARSSGAESTVKAMRDFVEAAQAREAPVQRLADSICGPFVYLILGLSTATFVFWQGFGFDTFKDALVDYSYANLESLAWLSSGTSVALRYAVNVLVVACPCALGLATPTSVLVGTSLAAKRGVLIRGGDVLEALAKVDVVVVDKTGTVTQGRPAVVSVESEGMGEGELMGLAAALEANASAAHPIARAIVEHAGSLGSPGEEGDRIKVGEVEYATGKGVKGVCDGRLTAVGSPDFVREVVGCNFGDPEQRPGTAANTEVYVGVEGRGVVGRISLVDSIRPEARSVLDRLSRSGVESVYMLSGDRQPVVSVVASRVGIQPENALGGQSPFDKADFVARLRGEGRRVCMIGDGINDTLALSEADVGIAVSGGMDAASDAADIVLLGEAGGAGAFAQVEDAVAVSRTTFAKIKQNLGWALLYNAFSLPLATGALLPTFGLALDPAVAGAMMAGSSLTVLLNSLSIPYFVGEPGTGAQEKTGDEPGQEARA